MGSGTLWTHAKPAQIVTDREEFQIWYAVESGNPGVYLVDKDGVTLFREPFRHAHYGWIARHDPVVPGLHPHTAEDSRHEYGGEKMRDIGHFPIFLLDARLPGGGEYGRNLPCMDILGDFRENIVTVDSERHFPYCSGKSLSYNAASCLAV